MGTEAFYATAAQVMPTILIALAVEVGFILQFLRRHVDQVAKEGFADLARYDKEGLHNLYGISTVLGVAFLVGEVLAFLVLGFRWFNGWTFIPISVCLLAMIVGAFLIPLTRLFAEVDSE
jgi:ABC-type Fe3+-siderophore transport system permease subunit